MLNFQGKLDTVPKIMKAIGQMIIREGLLTPKVVQQVSDEYIRDGFKKKERNKNCILHLRRETNFVDRGTRNNFLYMTMFIIKAVEDPKQRLLLNLSLDKI